MLEQHDEKIKNANNSQSVAELTRDNKDNKAFKQRNLPRKAKKYVFFDVNTGNIMFEYGGTQTHFTTNNNSGNKINVYELGCLVKEIREEEFTP